jgi:hypothetical protein
MSVLIKSVSASASALALAGSAVACPWCRVQVNNGIYDQDFLTNLLTLLLPLLVIAGGGIGLYNADKIAKKLKGGMK